MKRKYHKKSDEKWFEMCPTSSYSISDVGVTNIGTEGVQLGIDVETIEVAYHKGPKNIEII